MERTPVEAVEELYEAFGRRDIAKVFGLLAADVEIAQSEELPWGGVYCGHEGAREFFGKLGSQLNSTLEIERLIHSGDHVTAVGWTTGTVKANGASYRVPIAHVWRLRDGQVSGVQFLIENALMLDALGLG
jgi:hypothetical protein